MRLILAFWNLLQVSALVTTRFYHSLTQIEQSLHLWTTFLTAVAIYVALRGQMKGVLFIPDWIKQRENALYVGMMIIIATEAYFIGMKSFAKTGSGKLALLATCLLVTLALLQWLLTRRKTVQSHSPSSNPFNRSLSVHR